MIQELVIASQNKEKVAELEYYTSSLMVKVHTLASLNIQLPPDLEAFSTYRENAHAKAHYAYEKTHLPILADDSGLEVESLGGIPGIHSARFSPEGSDDANRRLMLQKLQGKCREERKASFICVLCWITNNQTHYFEGRSEGYILEKELGKTGFGYDPIFFDPVLEKSYAQLSFTEKIAISHRGKALRQWIEFLKEN